MPSHSAAERQALADALLAAGPDAPTLCVGWTARDLAGHVVARETRPDIGPGLMLPGPFRRWTQKVEKAFAAKDFDELVIRFRSGPPLLSPFAIPGVDARANLGEYFVHCEDVRRGTDGWAPRVLSPDLTDALWRMLAGTGRLMFRRSPMPVVLRTPSGESVTVGAAKGGRSPVTLTGDPGELVLYAFGRRGAAQVGITGDAESRRVLDGLKLGV